MLKTNDSEVVVTCPCGHSNKFNIRDWESQILESDERQMGVETHYGLRLEGVLCVHPGCDCGIDASIDVWEYPAGCENHFECSENVDKNTAHDAVSLVPS